MLRLNPGRRPARLLFSFSRAPPKRFGRVGHGRSSVPRAPLFMQRTLIIFKPDCVQRRLVGPILTRFEAKGLRIAAIKLMQVSRTLAEKHYAEHEGKPFFEGLIAFITGGPVIVGVLEGNEAITVIRSLLGATNGVTA